MNIEVKRTQANGEIWTYRFRVYTDESGQIEIYGPSKGIQRNKRCDVKWPPNQPGITNDTLPLDVKAEVRQKIIDSITFK